MVEAKEYKLSVTSCISWILLAIITATIAITLLCKYPAWDSKKKDSNNRPNKPRHEKWFYVWLIGLSTLGGFWALFLPLALSQKFDGPNADGNQLRLHLLYITGGVLALTTLGETHRKNTLEKHKNDQDHIRQVHAERRSRYTTAIEQLSSDKASIRLGGVYTLVGLVDEWLADEKTTPSHEERRKEGQVIINNLCAYIRSPFDLAERYYELTLSYEKYEQRFKKNLDNSQPLKSRKEFMNEKAYFYGEKEVRLAVLDAIKTRLNGGTISQENSTEKLLKETWSGFNYNFSNTIFFYPVDCSNSYFGASSNFSRAEFTEYANFSRVKFTENANFSEAKFTENANFFRAEFTEYANFSRVKFTENANFSEAEFIKNAHFLGVKFTKYANFSKTEFIKNAHFLGVKFTKYANFSEAKFTGNINFSRAEFTGYADFFRAKFTGNANFSEAKFIGNINFSMAAFQSKPIFEITLDNKAKFSNKADPRNYNFEVSRGSCYKIETEEKEYNGTKFIIPKDAELFDPDEPSAQENNDDS